MRLQRRLRLVPTQVGPGRGTLNGRSVPAPQLVTDSGGYGLRVRSAAGATGPSTSSGNSPERVIEHLNRPGPEELRKDILPQGGLLTIRNGPWSASGNDRR